MAKKEDRPVNWAKVIREALQQDQIIKSVFCARCVWLLGKLVNIKRGVGLIGLKDTAKQHYLTHLQTALNTLAEQNKKIVQFSHNTKRVGDLKKKK